MLNSKEKSQDNEKIVGKDINNQDPYAHPGNAGDQSAEQLSLELS